MKKIIFLIPFAPLNISAQDYRTLEGSMHKKDSALIASMKEAETIYTLVPSNEPIRLTMPQAFEYSFSKKPKQIIPLGREYFFKNESNSNYALPLFKYDIKTKDKDFDSLIIIAPNQELKYTFKKGEKYYYWSIDFLK